MRLRGPAIALLGLLLAACATTPTTPQREPGTASRPPVRVSGTPRMPDYVPGAAPLDERDRPPADDEIPPGIDQVPDAVPQEEPRSRGGNSARYEVFGKTYSVMDKPDGFRERGHASWYGKKFHGRKTANGEIYDMFKMTAAHKRLPLPSYVRVTNVANGKSTVVRVNDRGPFHKGRIIDLSYAAAAKLGILKHGAAMVEIEALQPGSGGDTLLAKAPPAATPVDAPPPPAPPPPAAVATAELRAAPSNSLGYLQVASFIDPINAIALREELHRLGFIGASVLATDLGGETLHRVVTGPFNDEAASLDLRRRLRGHGYAAEWMIR
ncbi:MAG TPA: septal ring lytic transglycosylase RlpA family protein [Solimonas sp.]|nr:septal ring lytic transglycosylase RlpA family protein [Solimonas sp.]